MKSRPKTQLPVRRIPVHELFPQPEMARTRVASQQNPPSRPRQKLPSGKNILWALVFLGLIMSGFGAYGIFGRKADGGAPYVLLEVRALEVSGHPVTAADVIVNEKKMGVTDSFGEWRRYLQLRVGDEVKIELAKTGSNPLTGSKTALVPKRIEGKQDIELQLAIEMKGKGSLAAKERSKAKSKAKAVLERSTADEDFPTQDEVESLAAEERPNAKPKTQVLAETEASKSIQDDLSDTNDNSLGIYFDDGLNRISVVSSPKQAKPNGLMDKRQQDVVRERVLPVLVNDLQNLGLAVDKNSPWKLALSYISNGEQVGYIRAEIEWHSPFGQTERSSFIAGFAKTYEETGRALSSLLRLHMKKTYWAFKENGNWFIDETGQTKDFWRLKAGTVVTDTSGAKFPLLMTAQGEAGSRWKMKLSRAQPCEAVRQRSRCMVSTESVKEAPPLAGWVLKRARILGAVPTNADVYVAGFQAHSVGNGQWEFWSRSGSNLKALVLANGRIIHSEAFVDNPGESVILKMATAASSVKTKTR